MQFWSSWALAGRTTGWCICRPLPGHDGWRNCSISCGSPSRAWAGFLKDLIDKGYVFQKEGETDRRQRLLHLTKAGEELRQQLMAPQISRIRRAVSETAGNGKSSMRDISITWSARKTARASRTGLMAPASSERKPVTEARHILVVDDDRRIRELIRSYLMENDFLVSVAGTAAEARERMRGLTFDLMVLDIMMPGETGLELTKSLRREKRNVPILMLSALADSDDRIAGLATGSDDYLAKPFEPRELLLRINNLLRRVSVAAPARTEVRFGVFQLNVPRGELRRNGDLVRLTSAEKNLLRMLSLKPGTPLSRLELSQPGLEESARSVDVQINRLRQKIESDPANPVYLQTVRGAGYALYVDEEAAG